MPSQSQWLRARAIHSFLKSSDNVDCSIHQLVFKFCDCPPQIFSGKYSRAFSLLTDWGSVVTWGHAEYGGDSRGVAEQLSSRVQTVVGNSMAFAAVKVDGSVVTWGDAERGGDSLSVAEQLSSGVQTVVGKSKGSKGWRGASSLVSPPAPVQPRLVRSASFTAALREICEELFHICDRNKSGAIDRDEYRQVARTVYSLFLPKERVHWQWKEMDKDEDGKVSLIEWLSGTEAVADFVGEEPFLTALLKWSKLEKSKKI